MKNQPEVKEDAEYPSWGQGPFVQVEESVEGDDYNSGRSDRRPFGNAANGVSCYECE